MEFEEYFLESVFVPADDVVLTVRIKLDKIGRVAGDTNDEIAVSLGILLSGPQGLGAHDVVLDFHAAVLEVYPGHVAQLANAVLASQRCRVDS